MLGRLRAYLRPDKPESLAEVVDSLPQPSSYVPHDVSDPIGAQGDKASAAATHGAHPELGRPGAYRRKLDEHLRSEQGENLP